MTVAKPSVFMMDLLCTVPYYTGHLCGALAAHPVEITLGSITYHLDPSYFSSIGIRNAPGPLDIVGKCKLGRSTRRVLKLIEYAANLLALAFRKTDILHVHFLPLLNYRIPLELWLVRWMRWRGAAVVYTVHNLLPHDTGEHLLPGYRRLYESVDRIICHNAPAREQLIRRFGVEAARISVIPHGPLFNEPQWTTEAARQRLAIPPGQCMALWQGFIKPYKGISFLLAAWARICRQKLNARLFIVGTGETAQLESIRDQVSAAGFEDDVELVFRFVSREELSAYYQAADILVYPYREVTTSGALLTGLNYRKPIVATTLPPFQELLDGGAVLLEYGDVAALESALAHLIRNPNERDHLAAALSNRQPSWAAIAAQTLECYAAARNSV
jgi:glycosyltransferase involved in cell wall biosynthesis